MSAAETNWGKSLQAVLWDLDGTLMDSYPAITASVNHVRAFYGMGPMTVEAVRVCVGHGVIQLMAKTVPGRDPQQARLIYAGHHEKTLKVGTKLLPGAGAILRDLRARGVRHAVCSNKPREFSAQLLDHLEIACWVDVLLGPEDVAAPKPAPDMLLLGLERLGTRPEEAFFVGDMTVDIQAARSAGLRVAVVATGSDSADKLKAAGPDVFAPDLGALARILSACGI